MKHRYRFLVLRSICGDVVEAAADLAFSSGFEYTFFFQAGEQGAGVDDANPREIGGFGA